MTWMPNRRNLVLGTSTALLTACRREQTLSSPKPRLCSSDDKIEVDLQSGVGPKLVLRGLRRNGVDSVHGKYGSFAPAFQVTKSDCAKVFAGQSATLWANEADPTPTKWDCVCGKIIIGAGTEADLRSFGEREQGTYHAAYKSGDYKTVGDWCVIPSVKTGGMQLSFYDPSKITFANDIWLTFDGITIGVLYKDYFLMDQALTHELWAMPIRSIRS
ncbi:MAG: hypothetical protein WDN02_10730 [Methylovirgula sp.]|uniref:hypothetical protein n=1 Tax=Methylovirgula sp. TaxID=1978224 RepID=UPI0030764547